MSFFLIVDSKLPPLALCSSLFMLAGCAQPSASDTRREKAWLEGSTVRLRNEASAQQATQEAGNAVDRSDRSLPGR